MKKDNHEVLEGRKRQIEERLKRKNWTAQVEPMFEQANIGFEVSDRARAINCGGIGVIRLLVSRLKLAESINRRVRLLKAHLPYSESDHVLNIAYNIMSGGNTLEDIKQLRKDEVYLDALSAQRIPDATTAGDFLRRFDAESILDMQEAINDTRRKVWAAQEDSFKQEAVIDADGTISTDAGQLQTGDGHQLQGNLGIRSADHFAGQHKRGSLFGKPARKQDLSRRSRRMAGPGNRSDSRYIQEDSVARRHRLLAH